MPRQIFLFTCYNLHMKNSIKTPSKHEEWIIKVMILFGLLSIANFVLFFFDPEHKGNSILYILLCVTMLYSIFKKLYMWYNYANISVPEVPKTSPNLKIDILTTYFPGEPYQMIVTTLEAITKITYPHTAYLCDEANDPYLKKFCEDNGIVHVTRNNRIDAKAGNINNALRTVARGEVCVVLDPDHIPEPDFLDNIIPFFADPKIGFVQIVQSYYNTKDTLVARGAAEQTFQFYGPMMMTLHSYGTVNAIGANCVFRRKALDSIGGHAPGLCEDMHTAMCLYSKGWKSVYLPEVLAKGLAPSNLTTYFKQQLKWARGTFDLLFKVYPKLFKDLTPRQRIHFGILPLHYLSGVMYLINFLIPILSLLFSTTPWRGNILDFILAILPLVFSALLIRAFVQKWVIEKEERGFHITGGLLQINTWWVYILGLIYTLFNKKVPYLPTPKENEFNTNVRIVIPNIIVAIVSVFAIVYGLQKDFTPFSIFMAGFAFFNTCIMLFGVYLAVKVTNQNRILRTNLNQEGIKKLYSVKEFFRGFFHRAFTFTRKTALPLLALILMISLGFRIEKQNLRWGKVESPYYEKQSGKYLGIFYPTTVDGITSLDAVNSLEAHHNIDFDIISFYLAWDDKNVNAFPTQLLQNIASKNAIPMITWEPWASLLPEAKNDLELSQEKKVLKHISQGVFDTYIEKFAEALAAYDNPVYLRFAHEFNNPQYPWSQAGENTPEEFKAAWIHIYDILKSKGAREVMMVWNPWSSEGMENYYPGDKYVDWIGVTALDYQNLNMSGNSKSFSELYTPFHENFYSLSRKPVMLAEFGSLNLNQKQPQWIKDAVHSLSEEFEEIEAVVLFYSAYDKNIPSNDWYDKDFLNWTIDSLQPIKRAFDDKTFHTGRSLPQRPSSFTPSFSEKFQGVRYKKGLDWKDNYYVLTRDQLVEDLENMKKAGINTIQFKGGNIYDYNILKYTAEKDLQAIYEFDVDLSKGFINNWNLKKKLQEKIIKKVEELKDEQHIIAYSFSFDLDPYYTKPLIFKQKHAYIEWLHDLLNKIKSLDPEKAIFLDIPLKASTPRELKILETHLPVDSYGLMLNDSTYLQRTFKFAQEKNIPLHLSSVPTTFLNSIAETSPNSMIVENWQDERLSYRLSFDGMINFSGKKKKNYFQVSEVFSDKEAQDKYAVKFLKPAAPLLPGEKHVFTAALFKEKWYSGKELPENFSFEWWLIKNDIFGNPLAAKKLGEESKISVSIPEDYKEYELLLSVSQQGKEGVVQFKDVLYTPLYHPIEK